MDPLANLREQRELAQGILADYSGQGRAVRLAELAIALDEWQAKGGYSPYSTGLDGADPACRDPLCSYRAELAARTVSYESLIRGIVAAALHSDTLALFLEPAPDGGLDMMVNQIVDELIGSGQCVHGELEPSVCSVCSTLTA